MSALSKIDSQGSSYIQCSHTNGLIYEVQLYIMYGAACSVAVKLLDLDPHGRWFDSWCGHYEIHTAVGPLSKALNSTLLHGECLLLSLINCKSLWRKASAE